MSSKKLQILLNPNCTSIKDQGKATPITNKPLSTPHSLAQLGSNTCSNLPNPTPPYSNFQTSQNLFYNPTVKSNEPVCPSPMVHFSLKSLSKEKLPTVPVLPQHTFLSDQIDTKVVKHDVTASLNSFFSELQGHFPRQPRTLDELLHRSYSSQQSNSMIQSFHTVMPSPFIGPAGSNSFIHRSVASDHSKFQKSSLLGTPLHNADIKSKQMNAAQNTDIALSVLISQLREGLKNEKEIRFAITELLIKNKTFGIFPEKEILNAENIDSLNESRGKQFAQNQSGDRSYKQILSQSENVLQQIEIQHKHREDARQVSQITSLMSDLDFSGIKKGSEVDYIKTISDDIKNNITRPKVPGQTNVSKSIFASQSKEKVEDKKEESSSSEKEVEDLNKTTKSNRKKQRKQPGTSKGSSFIIGKKPKIKGKVTTVEEYIQHKASQAKKGFGDGKANQTGPLDDAVNESTTSNESSKSAGRSILIKHDTL